MSVMMIRMMMITKKIPNCPVAVSLTATTNWYTTNRLFSSKGKGGKGSGKGGKKKGDEDDKKQRSPPKKEYQHYQMSEEEMTNRSELDLVLRALDAPMKKEIPPPSPEEMERRKQVAKNYTIGMFREHNINNHDLQCKIYLKLHAVRHLPKNSKLKEAAMIITDDLPPPWRKIPTWTPPIEGFDPTQYEDEDDIREMEYQD